MLQSFRNKSQSIYMQAIVVVIALVFVFWGVGASMMDNNEAAIVVGGDEITFPQYQQAYDKAYENMSKQFGGNVPKGMAESLGLKEQVITQLIQATLLRQGGKEMGVQLSNIEIQHTIQAMSQFEKAGIFDIDTYNTVLEANRLSPTKFESNMRYDMIVEKTARAIGNFSNVTTDFEVQDLYKQINDSVAVNYVVVSPSTYVDTVQINEDKLAEWFTTVEENYKTAPQIKLDYLEYNYDTVGNKIQIDDATIANYYANNLTDFQTPEQRHVRHILFKASPDDTAEMHKQKRAQAEDILKRAQAGEDFATLAKNFSEGPSKTNGGDLGFFTQGTMVPTFDQAVFALTPDSISDIVKTDFGYHIIKVEEVRPASTRSIDAARDEIIALLQQEQAQALAFQLANNAYEGIISAGSLSAYLAASPEAPFTSTDFFSQENAPDTIKNDTPFLNAAFALQKGELSSLVKTTYGYAILFAKDVKEPETPALSDVKDQVTADYRQHLADEMAHDKAADFLKSLKADDSDFKELAIAQGLEPITSDYITRQDKGNGFPSTLIEQIFQLTPERPLPNDIAVSGDELYVFSYIGRKPPTASMSDADRERYVAGILTNKRQMIISAWLAHQQANVDITRHARL